MRRFQFRFDDGKVVVLEKNNRWLVSMSPYPLKSIYFNIYALFNDIARARKGKF